MIRCVMNVEKNNKLRKKMTKDTSLDLQIDENQLDTEWLGQSQRYFQYASKAADARRDFDAAKDELEVTKAEVDQSIRSDPAKFGLTKLTEATVASAVIIQEEYQKAQENVRQARYSHDVYQAAVSALDHRRKALENLVTLFMANYFSKPRAPKGAEDDIDRMEKGSIRKRGRRRSE